MMSGKAMPFRTLLKYDPRGYASILAAQPPGSLGATSRKGKAFPLILAAQPQELLQLRLTPSHRLNLSQSSLSSQIANSETVKQT